MSNPQKYKSKWSHLEKSTLLNIIDNLEEKLECINTMLDDRKVPREQDNKELSEIGRINVLISKYEIDNAGSGA